MALSFKKNIVVGVSVTPEIGLEVAQIDFTSKTVLKYGYKQLAYDNIRREISDMDIFKETLQDLFTDLQIPKGSEVVLNIPAVTFRVNDYPASLTSEQVSNVIEEELIEKNYFQDSDPNISAVRLPNSTIQFNKVAYTAAQKVMLIEIAMQIKELGYTLKTVDVSTNSTLNALIYNERVDVNPSSNWVLLMVENNVCRVLPMQGRNYVDCYEERISIGEVLGDQENYATVINAVAPILKNLPSQYLYVISKTNIISAEALAGKLEYGAPIIHQEANCYTKEAFLNVAPDIEDSAAKLISTDVIGAAINRDFGAFSTCHLNLFNASLGDVYILEQPPVLKFNSLTFTMSVENMIMAAILAVVPILAIAFVALFMLSSDIASKDNDLASIEKQIADVKTYLKENESISADLFDEGDEIKIGLIHNKNIYTYYTIVGTEIPKKLWLTSLKLGKNTTIEGQADNIESIYGFFRNIKDYDPESKIKLQKLGLASNSKLETLSTDGSFDTDSILTSMNADFYQFKISDAPEEESTTGKKGGNKSDNKGKPNLPDLEPID